jgi:hypothetical protein
VGAVAVGGQVGEEHAPLAAGKPVLHLATGDLDHEPPAQLDARRTTQAFPKENRSGA